MRLKFGAMAWLLGLVLYFAPAQSQGQVMTVGPDSVRVPLPTDTTTEKRFFLSRWDKPAKAAFFSAVIPGAGQFYNKAYWKIPIVYATGAVLTYFYIDNNNNYQDYREALLIRQDNNPDTKDQFADLPYLGEAEGQRAINNLKYRRDFWRRNRDLTIILSVAAYSLQIAEAYVHAHLKDFEVGEDLALRVQPNLVPIHAQPNSFTPGLSLTLYTRTK
ncbi:DUF5683 domain-containing protein [Pontibacter korlensis]|uniref:DUF5683 domain-containing protein n=1 Tax=Pontibacter korlensis TaxID=400092 RepID=A0A0E3UXT3_9BACT|nr:DUF5683 domain-containing protein [Pontibacter korlensis]AKD04517.1 hypothetical protein PKOR_17220 [Pontibacter korlensis]